MHIQTAMTAISTYIRVAKVENDSHNTTYGWGCGKLNHLHIVGRNTKLYITLGNTMYVVSYKTKYVFSIWSNNYTFGSLLQRSENLCLHKYLYVIVHSSFIHNSPEPETSQISFNEEMVMSFTDCDTVIPQTTTQQQKGMNYWYTSQLG